MTIDTRNTRYTLPGPPSDTEMEDAPAQLALPAPATLTQPSGPPVAEIIPTYHAAPTTIQATTPHGDLMALIDSIPAPIHIEHLQFMVSQNTTVHIG